MADVLVDHKEIEDAIGLGNNLATSFASVPAVDDDELKDDLEMPAEEQKKEEEAEKERVRSEEKRKVEEERVRVEAKKAKEEAERLRQEEEEVRRKSEENWEKRDDEAQAEKAAQVTRDGPGRAGSEYETGREASKEKEMEAWL